MRIPRGVSPHLACSQIQKTSLTYGKIVASRAYVSTELERGVRASEIRSGLQTSGFSVVDTPHNGTKETADKQLIVDACLWCLDNPAPATFVLVTGDKDFAYMCASLRGRRYKVVLICPERGVSESLRMSCDVIIDSWRQSILMMPPSISAPLPNGTDPATRPAVESL